MIFVLWSVLSMVFGVANYRSSNSSAEFAVLMGETIVYVIYAELADTQNLLCRIIEVLLLSIRIGGSHQCITTRKSLALSHAAEAEKHSATKCCSMPTRNYRKRLSAEEDHRKKIALYCLDQP